MFVSLRNVQQPQVTNIRPNWSAAVHRTLSFFSADAYIVIVTVIAIVIVGGVNGPQRACCMQTSRWITTVRRHIDVTVLSVVRHHHCQEVKKRSPRIKRHRHSSPVFIILSKFLYICFDTAYFSYYQRIHLTKLLSSHNKENLPRINPQQCIRTLFNAAAVR